MLGWPWAHLLWFNYGIIKWTTELCYNRLCHHMSCTPTHTHTHTSKAQDTTLSMHIMSWAPNSGYYDWELYIHTTEVLSSWTVHDSSWIGPFPVQESFKDGSWTLCHELFMNFSYTLHDTEYMNCSWAPNSGYHDWEFLWNDHKMAGEPTGCNKCVGAGLPSQLLEWDAHSNTQSCLWVFKRDV